MIRTTTYSKSELKRGKCSCCGEMSNEILRYDEHGEIPTKDNQQCIDCIEMNNFYDETMKGI